ncbi:F-box only protein 22 isoform X2 [Parasteatoda tepidariorum]|uniref:F-box only protein 22 isoform X2 n=1 Tax=Parasteatoda tepidariorum TaxID=114398 RepID=UPI00077FA997|nr:F-box only protein 22 isoform X2 [Parasteatoda tepidariorum]
MYLYGAFDSISAENLDRSRKVNPFNHKVAEVNVQDDVPDYNDACEQYISSFEYGLKKQLESLRVRPTFCIAFASYSFLEDFEVYYPTYIFGEPDLKKFKRESNLHKRKYLNSVMKIALGSHLPSRSTIMFTIASGIIGCCSNAKVPEEVEDGFALSGFCFPNIPGVEIHHFPVDGRKCDLSNLVPKETKIKCLLAFLTPRGTSIIDKLVQSCLFREESKVAVGGAIVDRTQSLSGSAVVFCGKNIEASSVIIGLNDKCEEELKNKLKIFQETGLLKNRCYAFMFACVARGYSLFEKHNYESAIFHSMYPDIPLIGVFGNGEIGVNYFPHVSPENKVFQSGKFPRCVKKYLHSYTTVFVLISIED